jgi:hypothetical protein
MTEDPDAPVHYRITCSVAYYTPIPIFIKRIVDGERQIVPLLVQQHEGDMKWTPGFFKLAQPSRFDGRLYVYLQAGAISKTKGFYALTLLTGEGLSSAQQHREELHQLHQQLRLYARPGEGEWRVVGERGERRGESRSGFGKRSRRSVWLEDRGLTGVISDMEGAVKGDGDEYEW